MEKPRRDRAILALLLHSTQYFTLGKSMSKVICVAIGT